ncbi:MAG: cytochrome c oxidase assembly protein [Acidimicrobiia bacterium]
MAVVAAVDVWRWQPHPEVWALLLGLIGLYAYAVRRIGPSATLEGEPVVTPAQLRWFVATIVTLWVASDWPVHDIAEEHLYSAHMAQHLLLSLVVPPMALLATPTWLARMVVGDGRGYRVVRWLTRLVPATILFNAVVVFSHWPLVVEASVTNPFAHYGVHLLVVTTGLIVWMGVCSPLPELRFSLLVQAAHLFLQSVVPTVPAGILVFAEHVAYESYDRVGRIWGLTALEDQQLAATMMKLLAGTYLWVIIASLFIRFANQSQADDRDRGIALDRRSPELTWAQVERELAEAGPAPMEP